jgi:sec-independent protein translocase protein TatA
MNLGPMELAVIAGIAILFFGPSQLPKLGRSLGETLSAFRGVGRELTETKEELREVGKDLGLKR